MPSKYKAVWSSMNESQQNAIKGQASMRVLDTQYKIDNFWSTRDLRNVKVESLNKAKVTIAVNESAEYKSPDGYMDAVISGFRNAFKK